jgi:hypothetical protein
MILVSEFASRREMLVPVLRVDGVRKWEGRLFPVNSLREGESKYIAELKSVKFTLKRAWLRCDVTD